MIAINTAISGERGVKHQVFHQQKFQTTAGAIRLPILTT